MDGYLLRKLQLTQLQIAKDVQKLCNKHSIDIFLDSGTLLGAVRHKGFIPWDDDFDFGITRDNLIKFLEVAQKELGDKYFIQDWNTDPYFGNSYVKIGLKNTEYIEKQAEYLKCLKYIFVDIIPYDNAPNEEKDLKLLQKKLTIYRSIIMCICNYHRHMNVFKRIIDFLCKNLFSKKRLIEKYNSLSKKWNGIPSKKMYAHTGSAKLATWLMPVEIITNLVEITFENETFYAPKEYERYLSIAYGDFMTIPDKSKQITHDPVRLIFSDGECNGQIKKHHS